MKHKENEQSLVKFLLKVGLAAIPIEIFFIIAIQDTVDKVEVVFGLPLVLLWLCVGYWRLARLGDKRGVLSSDESVLLRGMGGLREGNWMQDARVILTTKRWLFTTQQSQVIIPLDEVRKVWSRARKVHIERHDGSDVVAALNDERRWIGLFEQHVSLVHILNNESATEKGGQV